MQKLSVRDPYPFPKLQNDRDFCGVKPRQFQHQELLPTHLAQQEDPWSRLNSKHTLSSSRHETYHFDPQAPEDFLDFVIKSKYNHHEEFLKNRNEVLFQKETFDADHAGDPVIENIMMDIFRRKLKNRVVIVPQVPPSLNHPLVMTEQERHISGHSIKTAIESHHSQTTNKGYTRKPDGGFFTS